MSKKTYLIALVAVLCVIAGVAYFKNQTENAKAAKLESEILKGLTEDEIGLILRSQNQFDATSALAITESVDTRRAFLKGLKEHLALAAAARREGLADDAKFKINFEYKKNLLLSDLYRSKMTKAQGKPLEVSEDEIKAVWSDPVSEANFARDTDALRAIQQSAADVTQRLLPPTILSGESLQKARAKWAVTRLLSDRAKADREFIEMPELGLRFRLLEAGILSTDYLRKHFPSKIMATEAEVADYLAAHPEYDLKKKLQRAETVLARAKAGEDFAVLAKEFSEHRPTKAEGGLLEGNTADQIWPELDRVITAMEPNRIAETMIETELGFHIVKLESKSVVNGNGGAANVKYRIRHILFQRNFEEPGPQKPGLPPPFMSAVEIARAEIEKVKRNDLVNSVLEKNPVIMPDDFAVDVSIDFRLSGPFNSIEILAFGDVHLVTPFLEGLA